MSGAITGERLPWAGADSIEQREDAALPALLALLGSLGLEPEWCNLATIRHPNAHVPTVGPAAEKLFRLANDVAAGLRRLGWTPPGTADPRDATIAVLKAEVERLAGRLAEAGKHLPGIRYTGEIGVAASAYELLARLERERKL